MCFELNGVQRFHKRMTGFCANHETHCIAKAVPIAEFRRFSQAVRRRSRSPGGARNVENSSESLPGKEFCRVRGAPETRQPPAPKHWRLQHSLKCLSLYLLAASRLSLSAAVPRNPSKVLD